MEFCALNPRNVEYLLSRPSTFAKATVDESATLSSIRDGGGGAPVYGEEMIGFA